MTTETNQAAIQVFDAVLRADGSRCPRPDLERRFKHISPLSLNDAIATLVADGVLVEDGEDLRIPIADDDALAVALLAAVVNHVLVTGSPPVLTVERVCREVERDPGSTSAAAATCSPTASKASSIGSPAARWTRRAG